MKATRPCAAAYRYAIAADFADDVDGSRRSVALALSRMAESKQKWAPNQVGVPTLYSTPPLHGSGKQLTD